MFHYDGETLLEEIDSTPNEGDFFQTIMRMALREKDNGVKATSLYEM